MTDPAPIPVLPPPGASKKEGQRGKRIGIALIVAAVLGMFALVWFVFATNARVDKQEVTITKRLQPQIQANTVNRKAIQRALDQLDQDHSKPGIQLPRGATGKRGPNGKRGPAGKRGRRGASGRRGPRGASGGRGPNGFPGRAPTADEIAQAVADYLAGHPPLVGPVGPPGAPGVSVPPTDAQVRAVVCQVIAPALPALPGVTCP